ncbi:GNAT family N-acetyltransferase [Candidatus Poribacteria bacterium]|nr:GNAT family N-acetyltransferase [Candidatus Poribacteria bacterium]
MRVKVVKDESEFMRMKPIWDALLERCPDSMIYLTHEWMQAYWGAIDLEKERRMLILTVYDGNRPIAIAPFVVLRERRLGRKCRVIRFLGYDGMRSHLILTEKLAEAINAVLDFLHHNRHIWDLAVLNNLPLDSPNTDLLIDKLWESEFRFGYTISRLSPYIPLTGDWNSYLASRSRSLRKEIKYKRRRAEREYRVELKRITRTENVDLLMDKIVEVDARSWRYKTGAAIILNPDVRKALYRLTRLANERGWLYVGLLEFDGRPIAFEYKLAYNGTVYGLRIGYDEEYRRYSPGLILRSFMLQTAFQDGMSEFDLAGHNEEYKARWTSQIREHIDLTLYNRTSPFFILYSVPVLRRIKPLKKIKDNLLRVRKLWKS